MTFKEWFDDMTKAQSKLKVNWKGLKEQTRQVMKNIGAILDAAGYSFADVVKTTCLLSDMANYPAVNSVYGTWFPGNAPARAAYAVTALPLGSLIEIETIASK